MIDMLLTIVDGSALVAVDPVEADAAPLSVPLPGDAHLVLVPHRELHRQRLRAQEPDISQILLIYCGQMCRGCGLDSDLKAV